MNRAQLMANTMDQRERDFPWLVPHYKSLGVKVAMALAYQISPRHTDEYYAELTRDVLRFEPDVIYLKDQGGLMTPDRVRTLLPVILANAGSVPVEFHSHCTTGLAPVCYVEAAKLGVSTLHTGIPPLANGSAQPSVFSVVGNLEVLGHSHRIDLEQVRAVESILTRVARTEGLPAGIPSEYDCGQYVHQVPGGVISNLRHQLAPLGLQDRIAEVLEESVTIQRELGYPIMITPYSQFVVTQAALNVASGERYKLVADEIIGFAQGAFGADSGYLAMDANLKDRLLSMPRARERRVAHDHPSIKEIRNQLNANGLSDEEFLMLYIMKGDSEVKAMRAAGPYKTYSSELPIRTLFQELSKSTSLRYFSLSNGVDRIQLNASAPRLQ